MSFRSELATRDFIYIIMDLVPGEELLTLIQRERALPEDQARRIFGQLMGAVAFAHARGWAHRDLKPVKALLPPSDSSRFLSTCSSLPLVFGCSNVAC